MAPVTMNTEQTDDGASQNNTIVFNASKKELFTPTNGFKSLVRKLRTNWKVVVNKDDITLERLMYARLFILAGPREKISANEFEAIKSYLNNGGNILVLLGEGGENRFGTNINFLLEDFGIMVNNDAVVRTSYYKYFHPKEVYVANGILNREINQAAGKQVPGDMDSEVTTASLSLNFVYPFGATLNVVKPAIPVLSTGTVSLPVNRPVCAFYNKRGQGKLVVVGSVHIFSDQYFDKEENSKVQDVIFQWLTTNDIRLNSIDAEDPEISDYHFIPDTSKLAERLKVCLQEGEEVPNDFSKMFDKDLFKLDTAIVPEVLRSYEELHVKHEPLQLIPPQFETPLPPLQPAVFPPTFRELPGPSLELFDLDDNFSSEKVRIAQVTNKCSEEDMEYYVRECGEILGVTNKLPADARDAKHILEYVLAQVAEFKKLNQEPNDVISGT
ncbi:intraflagellar transport protein 52 homolog [Dendronephthya gigantea]|uniref:intraflagellar transport protein 52 homolog n=1 Tax=Dendronephthya gigantea TaxID=151771 RepID=UPI00106B4329|nr:intraflagellar transport protein 52 homolog [Dendronephthya gigantea]